MIGWDILALLVACIVIGEIWWLVQTWRAGIGMAAMFEELD